MGYLANHRVTESMPYQTSHCLVQLAASPFKQVAIHNISSFSAGETESNLVKGFTVFRGFTVFKGLEGFKRLECLEGLEGFKGLEGLRAGKRQSFTVVKGLERFKRLEGLEGLERFRAGKRQTWTPIRSH